MPVNLSKAHKPHDSAVDTTYNYKGSKDGAAPVVSRHQHDLLRGDAKRQKAKAETEMALRVTRKLS